MIVIKTKFFFLKKEIIWFPDKNYIYQLRYPLVYLRQHNYKIEKKNIIFEKKFYTNLIDLSHNLDDIHSKFKSTTRYDIRQSKKNNISIVFFKKYNFNEYNKFNIIVKNFYKKKHLKNNFNLKKLPLDNLFLIKTFKKNDWYSYSLYIHDDNRFRLLILINNYENIKTNMLGYSSKFMLWESIKYAKKSNFNLFDFGGLNLVDEENSGIDKFKLTFGGKIVTELNSLICNNLFIRILYKFIYFFKSYE